MKNKKHNIEINVPSDTKVLSIDFSANKDRIALLNRCVELLNLDMVVVKKQFEIKGTSPSYDQIVKFCMKNDLNFVYEGESKKLTVFCHVVEEKPSTFVNSPHKTPETSVDVVEGELNTKATSENILIDDDDDPFA